MKLKSTRRYNLPRQKIDIEFSERISEHQGIVHKVSRMYCNDEEDRKDLLQEILIQLWKSYPSFRGDAKFSTWMYRVALNVAIQDFRNTKKKQRFFLQTNEFKEISEEKEAIRQDEQLALMHKAVANLSKVEKAIVMLHLEEKPNEEIAEIVGISQNLVRVKMHRIKLKLKKNLNP